MGSERLTDIDLFIREVARFAQKHGYWFRHVGRPCKEDAYRIVDLRKLRNRGYGIRLYPAISISFDFDEKRWLFYLTILFRKSSMKRIRMDFDLYDLEDALKCLEDFAAGRI